MTPSELTLAAVYDRSVPVTIARIWENVLDWEHLPWLHKSSFADINCLEKGSWGWRAELRQTSNPENKSLMEIRLDQRNRRYVSRLIDGFGAGTEVWTYLEPRSETATDIRVEFHLPIKDREKAARVGNAYKVLYEKLWDEDEDMMVQRQNYLTRRPRPDRTPVRLGSIAEVKSKLPLTIQLGDEAFRVLEVEGEYFAHSLLCPHLQGPLDAEPVQGGHITCPWHGYRFDIRTGKSCDGHSLNLRPAPNVVEDNARDEIRLEWATA